MKSAFFFSHDASLTEKLRRAVREAGPAGWMGCDVLFESGDAVQVEQQGTDHLFTFEDCQYFREPGWTYQTPPHFPEPGVEMPDLATVLPYGVSCRWEDLFARLVRAVTEISGQPAWILDENSVIWDALAVDPTRVRL